MRLFIKQNTSCELAICGRSPRREPEYRDCDRDSYYHRKDYEKPRKLPMLEKVPNVTERAAVNGIIAKCLSADKKERYQHAQELFSDLTDVFEELEREKADEPQSPSKSVSQRKPFKEYSVEEVFKLVYGISAGFTETADAMKLNGIDGQYFSEMLENDDEDMTTSIAEGGLGFKKLQLRVVKAKIKEIE